MTEDDAVLSALLAREPLFHRPELGTDRASLAAMTADDFWEVGASGRPYSRAYVLDVLEHRLADPPAEEWTVTEPRCRALGPQTYLLTYLLELDGRVSRRATVWQHAAVGWQVVYHQGTLVTDPDRSG